MPSCRNIPENPDWVGKLDDAGNIPVEWIGSKIHNLTGLRKMGLNVPDGFYITTQAYRNHLRQKELLSLIENTLPEIRTHREPDLLLEQIRDAIIHTRPDNAFIQTVRDFYTPLASHLLAVRSSATCEDLPDTSFAGQHDTFLGICDFSSCLESIQKCWASLWTWRAFSYRQKNSPDHLKIEMAVLVQTMIKPDYAGVIFTVNPVSGHKDQMILESCRGLGKALVDGRVSPDRFVLSKKKLTIISKEPSKKDLVYTSDSQSRLDKQSCNLNPLQDKQAIQLARVAIRIEQAFGCPQDIEWAIDKEILYFLQTRPVTTHVKEKKWQDRQIWCNMNSGEVFPDVVTPITWSLIGRMFKPLFYSVWRLTGSELADNPVVGLVAGRAYFNLNTAMAAVGHFPKFIRKDRSIVHALGGKLGEAVDSGQVVFRPEDLPDLHGSLWKFFLRLPQTLWKVCYRYRLWQGKRFLDEFRKKTDALTSQNYDNLPADQLAQKLLDSVDNFVKGWDLLIVMGAITAYPILKLLLERWLHDTDGNLLNRIIRGQSDMEDVQAGLELFALADRIKEYPSLQQAFLSSGCWEEFYISIKSVKEGKMFLAQWNTFINRHGHHCRGELELYNLRWSEMPDYVFDTLRNYYSGIDTHNPARRYTEDKNQQDQLVRQIRSRLRNPLKRWLVFHFIRQYKEGARLRENWKSQAVRYVAWLRKWLLVLGQSLCKSGVVESSRDIFFMKLDELLPAAGMYNISGLRTAIQARREEYNINLTLTPPSIIIGQFNPKFHIASDTCDNTRILKGLSVFPGKVIGLARVILKTDTKEQVLPGEILVAPFTDPGWTPYFLTAAGIVMDMGGLLSHGSIVAREYGIPSVVNVGPATKIIKTGQKIILDADQGIVTVIQDDP